jgi:hypothetical protein
MDQRRGDAVVQLTDVVALIVVLDVEDLQTIAQIARPIVVDCRIGPTPHGLWHGISDARTFEQCCAAGFHGHRCGRNCKESVRVQLVEFFKENGLSCTHIGAVFGVASTRIVVFCGIFSSVPVIEFTAEHQ